MEEDKEEVHPPYPQELNTSTIDRQTALETPQQAPMPQVPQPQAAAPQAPMPQFIENTETQDRITRLENTVQDLMANKLQIMIETTIKSMLESVIKPMMEKLEPVLIRMQAQEIRIDRKIQEYSDVSHNKGTKLQAKWEIVA